jgi:hypothetical protein
MNRHDDVPDRYLVAPKDEGGTIYRIPPVLLDRLLTFERDFQLRTGGRLFFEDDQHENLTPFAVRLFRKGYVSIRSEDVGARVQTVTAIENEIEGRLAKIMETFVRDIEPEEDGIIVTEADLPFVGPLAAMPAGMQGTDHHRPLFGVRPGDDPVELLENILYGRTGKDDPEGSHYGEHLISDGVDL